ncbi:MAG TPA: nuclear transport factor 2 family protein [Nocardioidaceae bacterium]|jgi:ketosteroid isomerase-like protein|nr:nuclear transport factor 2 family protein [Nocardioidaceae bacterium]HSE70162.1 nuclear transport factor 2 family protein [Nocardioidaceae bacterium]
MTDEKDLAAVEEANAAFYRAFESADLDAMRALWVDDPEALCVHPGATPVRGSGAINRSWALIMANTPYIQFFLTDVRVSVLGDAASVTCTENVLTAAESADESTFNGAKAVATNVFLRTAEGWRLWIHHASPVLSGVDHED